MKPKFEPLFKTYSLTPHVTLKNRFVLAPLTHVSSNKDGSISEEELKYIEIKSKDVGMAITAATYSSENGIAAANQASVASATFIEGLSRQAQAMKKHGAKAILQVQHAGGLGDVEVLPDKQALGPSNVKREGYHQPRPLTHEEILTIIEDFGKATKRAIQAGFDGIEIHGANHYLLHQFCSPYYNRREDKWGDLPAFSLAVIDEVLSVRDKEDETFVIGYRFSPEEPEQGGIQMEHTQILLEKLIETDLDYLHASTMHVTTSVKEGKYKNQHKVELLRKWIPEHLPFIAVGSMYDPDQALTMLNKAIPLIALGRPLLIDSDYIQKIKKGEEQTIETALEDHREDRHDLTQPLYDMALEANWMPKVDKSNNQIKGGEESDHEEYQ